jgi:microcystin-dependent protein
MPATVIRGGQIKDASVQRVDLDVTTVGQAVVTKLIQGSNVTLTSTGADSGTGDVTIAVPTGAAGANAFNITSGPFIVPPVGQTTTVTLNDASWVVVGQIVYIDQAGGGQAGAMQVTAKSGNQITLLTPSPASGIPLASVNAVGLMNVLSGLSTDYVGGDNACHSGGLLMPTGTMLDFAGATAPTGFVLCDGTSYATTGAMAALFAVIGYTYGGSGANFNVPDARGRATVGAGQGSGLTNRALAAVGGEEGHVLTAAELASHTHTMANHYHYCAGVDHLHGMDHYHNWNAQGSHTHACSQVVNWGNTQYNTTGTQYQSLTTLNSGSAQYWNGNTDARATPAGGTVYASQTNGAWVNTGAADRSLAFNSGGPSTNTSDATGSGSGHNTMQPFIAINKIIKT